MSVHLIYFKDRVKKMRPVTTREEYIALRDSEKNRRATKGRMVQMNYSCLPNDGGTLKGATRMTSSVGADIDMQIDVDKVLGMKEEIGLLMLEQSATKGFHIVFRRHAEMSQEENLHWIAEKLGVEYDPAAKDITRVFFTPADKLIYLDDEVFKIEEVKAKDSANACGSAGVYDVKDPSDENANAMPNENAEATINANAMPNENANAMADDSSSKGNAEYPADYIAGATANQPEMAIPYSLVVNELCTLLGGEPAHGSRNNFIFSMAAYLRYICNDDPVWIARVLPTYGENVEKWRRTIESACQRSQYKVMPQIVKRAIENAKNKIRSAELGGADVEDDLPPEMPKKLPKLIAHLVKNVPEVCRPAVANAVFPALAAHLNGVKFWLMDGTEKEATFMCVTMAKQSSGKSAVNKPIEYIVADIVERDEINRKREQEWKDATTQKGANKEKPKRPEDLCVQVLVSDMTNAAFVQRMKDANGKYLYTNLEELDLLKQLQTNGTKDVGKIICLCFDNGKYGQERVGTQSVTARVDVRWNWNASSTILKGVKFFKGRMVDGTLSRVNFCTIIQDKSKPFVYGRYDEKYAEDLKPYIANLNLANGHVECKQALDLAHRLSEECADEAALSDDDIYQDLAHRAVTIAYLKAMVLYIAHDMTWSKEIAEFAEWSLKYDLWCKSHFFGEQVHEEKSHERIKKSPGRKNMLELLPESFSAEEAAEVRQLVGIEGSPRQMLSLWTFRGYIELDATGRYFKTKKYLKKIGGA